MQFSFRYYVITLLRDNDKLKFIDVNVFPLQTVFSLWLALVGPVANGQHTEARQVLRDIENALYNGIGRGTVRESATTHLHPAGALSQFLSLILHGDGGNTAILHPAVVLQGVTQHHNS